MTPFQPTPASTVNIDVASSSANVLVNASSGGGQVRIMNNGSATVWVKFGTDNTVAATTASGFPVGSGGTEVVTVPLGPIYVAAIAAGSTGKIYFTPGSGI
jgi:hypothetical protein